MARTETFYAIVRKPLILRITAYALFDDSGLYCGNHYTTELKETNQIIVTIPRQMYCQMIFSNG